MRFSITNLCFFSKVGGGLDTGEAAALASSPYNVLHESFKLGNIRGLMMFLLLIIVVTDVCYMAVDCSIGWLSILLPWRMALAVQRLKESQ